MSRWEYFRPFTIPFVVAVIFVVWGLYTMATTFRPSMAPFDWLSTNRFAIIAAGFGAALAYLFRPFRR